MKRSRNSKDRQWAVAIVALTMMAACSYDDSTIYDSYRHTNLSRWERTDTLFFDIQPIKQTNDYTEELGLRVNGYYPFIQLSLIVEQTIIPSYIVRTDTVTFYTTTANGATRGHGVNLIQLQMPIGNLRLAQGDSLHVAIHHNMRTETITGVSDVGLKISRTGYSKQ